MFLNRYPFGLVLDFLPVAFLQHIVPIVSTVEDIVKDDMEGDRVPFIAGSCAVSFGVQYARLPDQGALLLVKVMDQLNDRRFRFARSEVVGIVVIVVTVRYPAAVPLTVICPGNHGGCHTLGSHVPLQLRKDQDDFEHCLAHSGRCVKLLVFADEYHAQVLQFVIHGCEVQKVPGDTVNLPYQEVSEAACPDLRHHFLELRTVSVLAGVPGILEDNAVLSTEHEFCVCQQVLLLHWKRVLVYLVKGRHPDVDSHPRICLL